MLVGRGEQLAELSAALGGVHAGRGAIVAVVGEPGVGKSRLVRELAALAGEAGMLVLSGRAAPGSAPYAALSTALLPYARDHPLPADPNLEPFRASLAVLVPYWRPESGNPAAPEQPLFLAEALLRLFRAAAPAGALLVLEDLHWAEPETLTVLDQLADTLGGERLLCATTLREDGAGPALQWLARCAARRALHRIEVDRLAPSSALELAAACLGTSELPDGLARLIVERAEGLPLLVEDLLAGLVAGGTLVADGDAWQVRGPLAAEVPATFAQTVQARLAGLDPARAAVVTAAAVLGRRFDWSLLAPMTGQQEGDVLAALRTAVDRQIITTGLGGAPGEFRFRHALTREVVLASLLPPERAALARAAAQIVKAEHPGLPGEWCDLVTQLHLDAGNSPRLAELLLEQGRRALARGALTSAEAVLRRARAAAPPGEPADEVDAALTEVLALAGDVDAAFAVGERLLARSSALGDGRRRADVHLRLARACATAGQWDRARPHLDAVRQVTSDADRLVRAHALQAVVDIGAGRPAEAGERARAALEHAEAQALWDVACEALEVLGRCARPRDPAEAERVFAQQYAVADAHGLDLWRVRALHELGTIDLFETGRADRLEAAADLARRAGALVTGAHVDLHLGLLLAHRDEPAAARAALERAAELSERLRLHELHRVCLAQLAYALALEGADDEASARAAQALAEPVDGAALVLARGLALPVVHLLHDDRAAAIDALESVVPLLTGGTWPHWGLRALLRAVQGDAGPAAVADAVQRAEGGWPVGLNRAYVAFAEAVLAGRAGRRDEAVAAFARADRGLGWQVAHRRFCLRQVAEAALADRWGEPVPWLREALAEFEEHRAPVAAAACRALLERAGEPVPRRRSGGPPVSPALRALGVTSREAEVLGLVAAGLTNPQIAARLHLSRRTVESHVAALLAKTGAPARGELASYVSPGS